MVSERFPPQRGGVGVSAHRIATGLAPHLERLDVVHLTGDLPAGVARSQQDDRLTVFSLGRAARDDQSLPLLERVVGALHEAHDYDLLHGFFAVPAGAVAVLCAGLAQRPSLVSLRGNDLDRAFYHSARSALLQWTLSRATRLVGVSRELVRKARVLTGRPASQVGFLPNSVDCRQFRPDAPRGGDLPADCRVVLFSGEMRFKKGLEAVLAAAEQLPESVLLVLLGGVRKDEQLRFESWRREHPRAAARIRTLKYRRDHAELRGYYNRADLVVHPSLWDGMPNAVLEAMACARPVLATRAGGLCDLLEDGVTGFVMRVTELDDLAGRILDVLGDSRRAVVGEAAREKVAREFTPQREVQAHLRHYHELTAQSPACEGSPEA